MQKESLIPFRVGRVERDKLNRRKRTEGCGMHGVVGSMTSDLSRQFGNTWLQRMAESECFDLSERSGRFLGTPQIPKEHPGHSGQLLVVERSLTSRTLFLPAAYYAI